MSDDDSNTPLPNTVTWNLTKVEGSIAGVTHTFPTGLIHWTFNEDTNTLVVVNNNTDDSLFDFYDSGTYSYSVENNGTDAIVTIEDVELGAVTVTQDELIIDEQIDDGFVLTFTR
ncbi:MAG TPA: hypothetical protein VKZ98_05130 [Aquaticitalea sp.]|nr:hypothetical protein [Aquaticitalea sp.]